jgi:hypothetical protein
MFISPVPHASCSLDARPNRAASTRCTAACSAFVGEAHARRSRAPGASVAHHQQPHAEPRSRADDAVHAWHIQIDRRCGHCPITQRSGRQYWQRRAIAAKSLTMRTA